MADGDLVAQLAVTKHPSYHISRTYGLVKWQAYLEHTKTMSLQGQESIYNDAT